MSGVWTLYQSPPASLVTTGSSPWSGELTEIVSIQAGRVMKYGGGWLAGVCGGARNAVILKGNQEACQSRDFSEMIAS